MKSGSLASSAEEAATVLSQYDAFKRNYLDTERLAVEAGFKFTPCVCEAHSGAWSGEGRRAMNQVAEAIASTTGESKSLASLKVSQRMSIALHRATARALLQRLAATREVEDTEREDASAWAGWWQ